MSSKETIRITVTQQSCFTVNVKWDKNICHSNFTLLCFVYK